MLFSALRECITARLPQNRVMRGIITLASGTAIGQVITICAMPVITRLYAPAQIGVITVFLSFFTLCAYLLSWRYESALLVAKDDEESQSILQLGVLCVLISSVIAFPVLFFLIKMKLFGFGTLPIWAAYIVTPIFIGFGMFMMYRSLALRNGHVKYIAKASISRSGANALVSVLSGVAGAGVYGLFAAEFAGAWGPACTLYRNIKREANSNKQEKFKFTLIKHVMAKYSKFAKYELPSVAINQMGIAIPVPMLASLYGASAAGWYGLARMMVAIPNAQIGKAVGDTFQMEFASRIREGRRKEAKILYYGLLRKLSVFGLLPLVVVISLAPWLVPYIFGEAWMEMGVISAIIAPWLYASFVAGSLSRSLSVLQAQELKLIYDIASVLFMIIAYIMAKNYSLSMYETIASLVVANLFSYAIYLAMQVIVISKKLVDL